MMKIKKTFKVAFANDLDAFIPEVWAQESLMILENKMVMANLVHRDFENEIAMAGDVVNTRLPGTFVAKRKVDGDNVTVQDATATNVPVPLDQHLHTSFIIRDGEESKGFKKLSEEYLVPGMMSIAQAIDEILLGQAYTFLANRVGSLGTAASKLAILELRETMNNNKVPTDGRQLVVSAGVEADLLNIADFTNAEKIGDDGTAMREGSLGRRFGFNVWMSQNTPSVTSGSSNAAALNGAHAAGATTLTIDGTSETFVAGSWLTVAGDMTPQRITAATGTPSTSLTITPGLRNTCLTDAVVTVYTPATVNQLSAPTGYAAGYNKDIVIDSFSPAASAGRLVSAGAVNYSALSTPTTTGLLLNRSLEASIADGSVLGMGPVGQYCFGFHRNALALVMRPLAQPQAGAGALSFVANYNGLAVRVTITYNGLSQGHLVTIDTLCGVKTLDTRLGAVLLA